MMVLNERYEMLECIGDGGMAVVYRGRDLRLNREVAVKVLRSQFANDAEFVRRFMQEAHAAASLSHANIVSVYDVNEDDGTHYIVMELLSGRTLKDVIREEAPLKVEQALDIAIEVCLALQEAHDKGIIHRDIKPQNILFAADGTAKVSDFGIARALSSASMTETGTILGTVHYISPEQAQSQPVTPQSDLYSLGIVLYEMLTGKPPYEGDTPIAVALKHVQGHCLPLRALNPQLPRVVEQLVLKAMNRQPSQRFGSARQMAESLRQVRVALSLEPTATMVAPHKPTQPLPKTSSLRPVGQVAAPTTPQQLESTAPRPVTAPEKPSMPQVVLVSLLIIAALIGLVVGIWKAQWLEQTRMVQVPDLTGLKYYEAQKRLRLLSLQLEVSGEEPSNTYPSGQILRQEPAPETMVAVGSTIHVVVSKGVEVVTVPDVAEMSQEKARTVLEAARLSLGTVTQVDDESIPKGYVVRTAPSPGTKVASGTSIELFVSKGPKPPEPPEPTQPPEASQPSQPSMTPKPLVEMKLHEPDPENPDSKVVDVSVKVPDDSPPLKIRMTKSDDEETDVEVMNRTIQPGESADTTVKGTGQTAIKVYADGEVIGEDTF